MNVDELLKRWASTKLDIPEEDIFRVTFRHEDGWTSDAGTGWPEENYAIVSHKGKGTKPKTTEFNTEGYESLPELLNEILSATPRLGEPPVPFVFGFMHQFGDTYAGVVAKSFWEKNGYLDDQSSIHSAGSFEDDEEADAFEDWFSQATAGILGGEAMESTWELLIPEEEAKTRLESNGFEFADMSKWDENA